MTMANDKLSRLRRAADDLEAAIAGLSDGVLSRRPAEGAWAATEVVCHLRDVEEFYLMRVQLMLANTEPTLTLLDPDRWAEDRQYQRNDASRAARSFRARREETLSLLDGLAWEQWERGAVHPLRGRITVRNIVSALVKHDAVHLDQIRRALAGQP